MTDTPSLEERVAALEAALAKLTEPFWPKPGEPIRVTYSTMPPLSEAEVAEIRASVEEALKSGPPPLILSPEPPLSPAQVRYLLRQCVTVVGPGETLIVRVPLTWTPAQVSNYARDISDEAEALELPFRAVVIPADELAIAAPGQP